MNDKPTFRELELLAAVCPSQSTWPTDYLHWQRMGVAATEARSRLGKFLEQRDEIEADPRLTPEGQRQEGKKASEKALAALDASNSLQRAQESVAAVEAKWEAMTAKAIKKPTDANDVAVAMQVRDKLANMKESRMAWLEKHADDPVIFSAIMSAPQALSGLTDAEWRLVQLKAEAKALPPDVREAKLAVAKAWSELQRGWRTARARITHGGGLEKAPDGSWGQVAAYENTAA
jgi:hypothetical protein